MAARVHHGTLVASTVTAVVLSEKHERVLVYNRGTGDIFVSTNGVDPTVGGDDVDVVPSNQSAVLGVRAATTDIRLISSGTPAFSVVGV